MMETLHFSALQKHFQRYFPMQDPKEYDWIRDPFSATPPADLSTAEEEQFIDVTSDSTMRLHFKSKTLAAFWIGAEKDYPLLGKRALAILLPFATSYLCEIVASIKTKYRSKLDIENELRVAVSQLQPRFEKMCSMKQAHTSP
ncbi:protein FAM200A-like [Dicentrarchus labrax]|uniref:protein FAM200A-like n=1 Tax=Dicentrarchus labrax TaxID=13489 RepID=UPI0021F5AE50|nr:protein FAM200A-like [Dicentrarchus labrax]